MPGGPVASNVADSGCPPSCCGASGACEAEQSRLGNERLGFMLNTVDSSVVILQTTGQGNAMQHAVQVAETLLAAEHAMSHTSGA